MTSFRQSKTKIVLLALGLVLGLASVLELRVRAGVSVNTSSIKRVSD